MKQTRTVGVVPVLVLAACVALVNAAATESLGQQPDSKQGDKSSKKASGSKGSAKAPAKYTVRFDTTKGPIIIDVDRSWAPRGADRFYQLVKNGYYNDVAFFRVIDGFMAQTGINGDPAVNRKWQVRTIKDDPVTHTNYRGTVAFATSGPSSRTTQIFINLVDNLRLDTMGFTPFGKVRNMKAVDALYSGYGEGAPRGAGPSQALIQSNGNAYLKAQFPKLDYIKTAKIVKTK